jgi:hypothetical protein
MAPSRGAAHVSDETAIAQQSSSALISARRNLSFLLNPSKASPNSPTRLRTRALLRTLRYISIFVFWRVVRYAKYIAVASLVASVGAAASGVVAPFAW